MSVDLERATKEAERVGRRRGTGRYVERSASVMGSALSKTWGYRKKINNTSSMEIAKGHAVRAGARAGGRMPVRRAASGLFNVNGPGSARRANPDI